MSEYFKAFSRQEYYKNLQASQELIQAAAKVEEIEAKIDQSTKILMDSNHSAAKVYTLELRQEYIQALKRLQELDNDEHRKASIGISILNIERIDNPNSDQMRQSAIAAAEQYLKPHIEDIAQRLSKLIDLFVDHHPNPALFKPYMLLLNALKTLTEAGYSTDSHSTE